VDFPIPESAMQTERDNILREYMQRAMQQGASREDFEVQKEELMEGAEKAARDRVKLRLILSRIAEQEKIEATNDDLSQMVMRQAMMNRQKPDELVKELQKDRSRVDEMRQEIIFGKTLDLLQEKAVKTPVSEDAGKEEPAAS
jgi:trigger factor